LASLLEDELYTQIKVCKLPLPERQYRFAKPRRFRADFAWPQHKLIVEVEGGIYSMGWHQSIGGFLKDIEKYNLATLSRWYLLRFSGEDVINLTALRTIEKFLGVEWK
jgi:very-short-patch-repair endonuclease